MVLHVALALLISAAAFGGVVMMTDRPRGANVAQGVLMLGGALAFATILVGPVGGISPRQLASYLIMLRTDMIFMVREELDITDRLIRQISQDPTVRENLRPDRPIDHAPSATPLKD